MCVNFESNWRSPLHCDERWFASGPCEPLEVLYAMCCGDIAWEWIVTWLIGRWLLLSMGSPLQAVVLYQIRAFLYTSFRQKKLEMQHFSINHLCLVIIVETFRSTCYLVLSLVWWTYPIGQLVIFEVLRLNPRFKPTWALRKPRRNDEQSQ